MGRTGSSRGRPLSPGDEAAARRARAMVKGASMGVKVRGGGWVVVGEGGREHGG